MKYQVLFLLKNNEKVLKNVVCCSRNWGFKGDLHNYKGILWPSSCFFGSQ